MPERNIVAAQTSVPGPPTPETPPLPGLELLAECSPDIILFVDPDGRVKYGNQASWGIAQGDCLGLPIDEIFPGFEAPEFDAGPRAQRIRREQIARGRIYALTIQPVDPPGSMYVHATDVTEYRHVGEQLQESEQRYRSLIEDTLDVIFSFTPDGTLTYVGPQISHYGYAPKEVIGRSIWEFVHPEDRQRIENDLQQTFASGEDHPSEYRLLGKDGNAHWVESISRVVQVDGEIVRLTGVIRDITERKQAEEALQQGEAKYRALIETTGTGFVIIDQTGKVLDANPEYVRLAGYRDLNEICGRSVVDWTADYEKEKNARAVEKCLREGYIKYLEIDYVDTNGTITPIEINATVVETDEALRILTLCRDITERKQAELIRTKSLERQERLNQLQQTLLSPGTLTEKLKLITDGVVDIFGIDFCRIWCIGPGDLCEHGCMHAADNEGVHICRDRDKCLRLMASSGRYTHTDGMVHRRVPFGAYKIGRVASGIEHKFLTNDATHDPRVHNHDWAQELGLVSFAGYQLRPPDGETLGVLALFSTLAITPEEDSQLDALSSTTAQVIRAAQTEESLRESEERYRIIADQTGQLVYDYDITTGQIRWSGAITALTGHSVEEFQQIDLEAWKGLLHPDDCEQAVRLLDEAMAAGLLYHAEYRMRRKDGAYRDFENNGVFLRNQDGRAHRMLGTMKDISERKAAEDELRRQKDLLDNVLATIPYSVFWKDNDCAYLGCNRRLARDAGLDSPNEIVGKTDFELAWREQAELYRADDRQVMQSGIPKINYEEPQSRTDGSDFWLETSKVPLRDGDGKTSGILGIYTDITKRKQMEEALRESEDRYRTLYRFSADAIMLLDQDTCVDCNDAALRMLGYGREDLLGRRLSELAPPTQPDGQDSAVAARQIATIVEHEDFHRFERVHRRKDGTDFLADVTLTAITLKGKRVRQAVIRDITELRRAEEALHERAKELKCMYEIAHMAAMSGTSLEGILQEIVQVLPPAWLHQDVATAQIVFDGCSYSTAESREYPQRQHAPIIVEGEQRGTVEVAYTREMPELDEGPFLREERNLIDWVARKVASIIERMQVEEKLLEFKTAVEQSADGIALADLHGHIRFVNVAWARMHGYSVDELIGRHLRIFHTTEQYELEVVPFNEQLLETGSGEAEIGHVRRDGTTFPTWMSTTVVTGADQKPFGLLGIAHDITERKRMEEYLRYQLAVEEAVAAVSRMFVVPEGEEIDLTAVLALLGQAVGVHRAFVDRFSDDLEKMSRLSEWCSDPNFRQVGRFQDIETSLVPWCQQQLRNGKDILVPDVELLPVQAARDRELMEQVGTRALLVVPIHAQSGRLVGRLGFTDVETPRAWTEEDARAIRIVADMIGHYWIRRYVEEEHNELMELLVDSHDRLEAEMVEREKTQQVLRQTVDQYTALINTVPAAMYIKDVEGRYFVVNDAFCAFTGCSAEQLMGKTDHEINTSVPADDMARLDRIVMEERRGITEEKQLTTPDGERRSLMITKVPLVDGSGEVKGIVGMMQDVTNRQREREQLLQSEKLAAIGTLAAGVAHEINNPIGYINSNLSTMNRYCEKLRAYLDTVAPPDPNERQKINDMLADAKDAITESIEGTDRVRRIVTDLKSFSRVDRAEKEHANINEGITSTLNVVWNELKYKCTVEKEFGELPDLYCMPNQLNQVFMNLLVNASHAITGQSGLIKIKTWADDTNVHVSIKDNGCGIPEQNIKKIFEPFFTTKDVGKGTGLGLSLSYDIIKRHKGRIEVISAVGVGTEFTITLPREGLEDA